MVKTLEVAMAKAGELPEAVQELLGRELLERLDTLSRRRAEIEVGISELDGRVIGFQCAALASRGKNS